MIATWLVVGCARPVAPDVIAASTVPATVAFRFDWPDGGWGSVERRTGGEGAPTLVVHADVGVAEVGGVRQVRENVRAISLDPPVPMDEVASTAVGWAFFAKLPWTWRYNSEGQRVDHADRREAAAPLYEVRAWVEPLVEELWMEEPSNARASFAARFDGLAHHEQYEQLRDAFGGRFNRSLPMLHGQSLTVGVPIEVDVPGGGVATLTLTRQDLPCTSRGKVRCAEVTLVVEGPYLYDAARWVVEPASLLPWALERQITEGDAEWTVSEVWSWTVR